MHVPILYRLLDSPDYKKAPESQLHILYQPHPHSTLDARFTTEPVDPSTASHSHSLILLNCLYTSPPNLSLNPLANWIKAIAIPFNLCTCC